MAANINGRKRAALKREASSSHKFVATCDWQLATYNLQPATCNLQPANQKNNGERGGNLIKQVLRSNPFIAFRWSCTI